MNSAKYERRLLFLTYLFGTICFVRLGFYKAELLNQSFDKGSVILCAVICILIAYSHFVIRKFFPDGDKYIFVFAALLAMIGLIMLYRLDITNEMLHKIDLANNAKNPIPATSYAVKQVIWFLIGVAGYISIVVLFPDLKRFAKYKYVYLVFTIIFMAAATFFGKQKYGAVNWIIIGGFSFQPSEFGKLFLVIYLGAALKNYKSFVNLIEPAFIVMISLGFMVLQRDLGSALIIFGIAITMLYIATSKLKYIVTGFGLFAAGSVVSYKLFDHVRIRVAIWQDPWKYFSGKGYQTVQSMISIASGGMVGAGLGEGHPEFVPVNYTDFIFTVICEDLGILMGFAVLILFFLLFYRCMRAAIHTKDNFSRLTAVGYSAMIACQALVIIGGVINAVPLTGVTLPFVSYGGSSMLLTFLSLGIIQKISEDGM